MGRVEAVRGRPQQVRDTATPIVRNPGLPAQAVRVRLGEQLLAARVDVSRLVQPPTVHRRAWVTEPGGPAW